MPPEPIPAPTMTMWQKLRAILSREEQRRFAKVLAAIVVMAFFEVLGVFSILPFMQIVSQPETVQSQPFLRWVYETFGFETTRGFLFAAGVGVMVLLGLSNAVRTGTQWYELRVVWSSAHGLSARLLERYLEQPYAFFLRNNSADLGKQVLSEVNQLVRSVLTPLTELVARSIVTFALIALLVAVDPMLAFVVLAVLGGIYALIFLGVRRHLSRMGRIRFATNAGRYRAASEALQSIKTIRLMGCEDTFSERFREADKAFTDVQPSYQIIPKAARYFVEVVAFGGVIAIILYLLAAEGDIAGVLPTLSLYALAGYRLMPSLQQAFQAVSTVRYHLPAVDAVYDDLIVQTRSIPRPETPPPPLAFEDAIRVRDLGFRYAEEGEWVLRRLDLDIPHGHSVAFVGSTGSGKTTLVDLVSGLLMPEEGAVTVDGVALDADNVRGWQAQIGYVPQEVLLYDDTILRNIAFGIDPADVDRARVREVARIASVDDFIMQLPDGYETRAGERGVRLSGGQRQRIGLARALYRAPSVLILDEATSALDGLTEEAVMQAIADMEQDVTTIMIAHRLTTVKDCDHIYLLERGRIVEQGTYEHLLEAGDTFKGMAKLPA